MTTQTSPANHILADFEIRVAAPALKHIGHLRRQIDVAGHSPTLERQIAQIQRTLEQKRAPIIRAHNFDRESKSFGSEAMLTHGNAFFTLEDFATICLVSTTTRAAFQPTYTRRLQQAMPPEYNERLHGPVKNFLLGLKKLHQLIKNTDATYEVSALELPALEALEALLATDVYSEITPDVYRVLKTCKARYPTSNSFDHLALKILKKIDVDTHLFDFKFYYSELDLSELPTFIQALFSSEGCAPFLRAIGWDALEKHAMTPGVEGHMSIRYLTDAIQAMEPEERTAEVIAMACRILNLWAPPFMEMIRQIATTLPDKPFHLIALSILHREANTRDTTKMTGVEIYRTYQKIQSELAPEIDKAIIEHIFGWRYSPKVIEFCIATNGFLGIKVGCPLEIQLNTYRYPFNYSDYPSFDVEIFEFFLDFLFATRDRIEAVGILCDLLQGIEEDHFPDYFQYCYKRLKRDEYHSFDMAYSSEMMRREHMKGIYRNGPY